MMKWKIRKRWILENSECAKVKILRVIPSMNPQMGGPPQGLRNLIPALKDLGLENEVLCCDSPGENFGRNDKFFIHRLGPARGPWNYCRALSMWLDGNIDKYDVVIAHGIWLYHSYATMRSVKRVRNSNPKSNIKFYVMPHGMLDPWFQRDRSRKLKSIRNSIYWNLIERNVIASADGVLFTCQRELELAKAAFTNYRPNQEINVGYGVEQPPAYSPKMGDAFYSLCKIPSDSSYLLFLSRIDPKKGVDILINAYARLAQQGNINGVPYLVIAGPVNSSYADEMKELAKSLELPNVVFPGMLQDDAKWGAFYNAEAFVLPSHQENFGISVVEALACGRAVLISDQINIASDIAADAAGLVCQDNISSVCEMLSKWVAMSEMQRETLSDNATKCYRKRYAPASAADAILKALNLNNN